MMNEEIGTSENKERLVDGLKNIKRDPLTIMTLIVGSGFIGICFYFLGLYFLTVYLTGEQWNLRAIIFSPLPIDRLHAIVIGFVLTLITLGVAYLLIWKTIQALTFSKKEFLSTLAKNSFLMLIMSFIIAFFTSSSPSAAVANMFLYTAFGIILAVVVANIIHMVVNKWIAITSLVIWIAFLKFAPYLFQVLGIQGSLIELFLVTIPLLLLLILYWLLIFVAKKFSIVQTISLQSLVEDGFQEWKKYDNRQKRNLLHAIPALIIAGLFATIASTAHLVYTVGGDQWFGNPYQMIYVERAMNEETPADTEMSNDEGQQLYQDQGVYVGQQGNLVTYINQNGDLIRRNDVVMIQDRPSNAQGSADR